MDEDCGPDAQETAAALAATRYYQAREEAFESASINLEQVRLLQARADAVALERLARAVLQLLGEGRLELDRALAAVGPSEAAAEIVQGAVDQAGMEPGEWMRYWTGQPVESAEARLKVLQASLNKS